MCKKITFTILLLLLSIYLFSGCAQPPFVKSPPPRPQIIATSKEQRPVWVPGVPRDTPEYLRFKGIRTHALRLEDGLNDAREDARQQISKMLESRVFSDYEQMRTELEVIRGPSKYISERDIRDRISVFSGKIISGAKSIDEYWEKFAFTKETGKEELWYDVYVLMQYPKQEYEQAKDKILNISPYEKEIMHGVSLLNDNRFVEAIEHFNHFNNKYSQHEDGYYYLALPYISYYKDLKREGQLEKGIEQLEGAIRNYKIFLKGSYSQGSMRNRAVLDIKDLADDFVAYQLGKVKGNASSNEYKETLDFLHEVYNGNILYDLDEYVDASNIYGKLEKGYERYLARYFALVVKAWCNNNKQVKPIAVFDFMSVEGKPDKKSKKFASMLESEIDNLEEAERRHRDEDLLKIILKEWEFFQSGLLSDESRKELELRGINGIVSGKISSDKTFLKLTDLSGSSARTAYADNLIRKPSSPVWAEVEKIKNPNPDFQIDVWMDKYEYHIGEKCRIYFRVTNDSYVEIWNQGANNELDRLYPKYYNHDNFARAGKIYSIPSEEDLNNGKFMYIQDSVLGIDGVKAMASLKKFDVVKTRSVSDDVVKLRSIKWGEQGNKNNTTESFCTYRVRP
ncbi:MAG: hypothetical protein SCARUB_00751 [Candidatus Scalindua rubra]|uniref:DUF4384 domain-containing protein n=1 Tax=Candidatus Scalindua rubra TaxID=1872076 RepID=A0A1E3XEQ0_9BACT|nr:MAG: hypothetical protein SCARUB_00751 [Candidatus Scalindua rubra]